MFNKHKRICQNCENTFDIATLEAIKPHCYSVSFCSEECRSTYYENVILKKAKELGIDVPIEERWDILDL